MPKFYGDSRRSIGTRDALRTALAETDIDPGTSSSMAAYVRTRRRTTRRNGPRGRRPEKGWSARRHSVIGAVCFHRGAAKDGDRDAAALRVAKAITGALEAIPGETRLLVENTAGAGLTMGRTPDEVGAILASVPKRLRARTGYGLDTCHLFAAGHPIAESKKALAGVLDEFEATTVSRRLLPSQRQRRGLGSNRDRHMLIGEGKIGGSRSAGSSPTSARRYPLILETPQQNYEIGERMPRPILRRAND